MKWKKVQEVQALISEEKSVIEEELKEQEYFALNKSKKEELDA